MSWLHHPLKLSGVIVGIKFLFSSWPGRLILAALVLPFVLDGIKIYNEFSLKDAIVIDKQYQPAQAERIENPVIGATGEVTINYPEEWILLIEGHDTTGESKQREIVVTQEEFESAEIGSTYPKKE